MEGGGWEEEGVGKEEVAEVVFFCLCLCLCFLLPCVACGEFVGEWELLILQPSDPSAEGVEGEDEGLADEEIVGVDGEDVFLPFSLYFLFGSGVAGEEEGGRAVGTFFFRFFFLVEPDEGEVEEGVGLLGGLACCVRVGQ